ncbi:hypothetical protein [Methanoculleus chikugoensis]|uniref:hypothetical protein n=1 Tax=Methanoculleus chikugoensis TaxID=118126 RepID=UPI001FB4E232|nr:hypothetical protein [Methanoculleus chikugoensis]
MTVCQRRGGDAPVAVGLRGPEEEPLALSSLPAAAEDLAVEFRLVAPPRRSGGDGPSPQAPPPSSRRSRRTH